MRTGLVLTGASVLVGFGFSALSLPAAWLCAGLIVSGVMSLMRGTPITLPARVTPLALATVGILAASPLLSTSPGTLVHNLAPALVGAVTTTALGLVGAKVLLMSRREPRLSPQSALLAALPGGVSLITALATDMKAHVSYVVLSQYLRLVVISITLPAVTIVINPPRVEQPGTDSAGILGAQASATITLASFVLCAIIIVIGPALARRLAIPAPVIFGPLLLTVAVGAAITSSGLVPVPADVMLNPPPLMKNSAFIYLGWLCGCQLNVTALKQFWDKLPITCVHLGMLLSGCAVVALPLAWWTQVSYYEAYLATSPGALETVVVLSSESGAGSFVITTQLTRMILILVMAGVIPRLARAWR